MLLCCCAALLLCCFAAVLAFGCQVDTAFRSGQGLAFRSGQGLAQRSVLFKSELRRAAALKSFTSPVLLASLLAWVPAAVELSLTASTLQAAPLRYAHHSTAAPLRCAASLFTGQGSRRAAALFALGALWH